MDVHAIVVVVSIVVVVVRVAHVCWVLRVSVCGSALEYRVAALRSPKAYSSSLQLVALELTQARASTINTPQVHVMCCNNN
jgi:hypothetical protein